MKKYLLILLIIFITINIYPKRYIILFDKDIVSIKSEIIIKKIDNYKMLIVDSDIKTIRETFPDAIGIYEDKKLYATYIPNDQYFSYQWNLQEEHYNISRLLDNGILGSKAIIIGILDTGIAFEDFLIPSYEEDKVYSSDGYFHKYADFSSIDFIQGYDFVSNDEHPNDMNGHGTSCASIIASAINNNMDLSGIVYNVSIMPLRVLDENGEGNMSDIVSAIDYAVNNGCNVLNLSLAGAPGDSTGWTPLHLAIIDARQKGVAVVCATGNAGTNALSYPAGFEESIAIGAVDYYKNRTSYSQYGENIDFVAPGGVVYQDIDNDGYYEGGILIPSFETNGSLTDVSSINLFFGEGTSFAAPHITALIGLLYSLGYNNVDEIETLLKESSIDLGISGYDEEYGWGYPLPDSLFNIPVIVKICDFDFIQNIFNVNITRINDTIKVDSFTLSGRFYYKKIYPDFNNNIQNISFNGLNSGYYNFNVYYENKQEQEELNKGIIIKSPFDETNTVYDGDIKYVFSSNGIIVNKDRTFFAYNSDINTRVIFPINKNPSNYNVIHNGKTIDIIRNSKNIEFNIFEKGYYEIVLYENSLFTDNERKINKTIILRNSILRLDKDFEIYDNVGRRIIKSNNFTANINQLKTGIYFIKKGKEIWKVLKID